MSKNNHHFIPVTLQRQFASQGKKGLFFYDKEKPAEGTKWRSFKTIFYKKHLNTLHLPDGMEDNSLEIFYDRNFENYLPQIIRKLRSQFTLNPEALSHDEETILIQFFYNHMLCSPDVHGPMLKRHAPDTEFSTQKIDNIRVKTLGDQPKDLLDFLSMIPVVIAKPSNPIDFFIVGSNPVMHLLNQGETSGSLIDGKMELWAAFGSQLAVGFVPDWRGPNTVHLESKQVLEWNERLAAQSTSFAGCSKTQVADLAKRFEHTE
ncbi:DUF4238 domain-containing protein [Celeribacter persicus]|uniref:Uncharacterized protein DUF4238 n=1 Tax=Celeribacter persicus TaxID=1651082 RepID=A0A2T5HAH5_9RHOB|nr:DUF4238 domain-containing protein [Celeribacter persicus]PTQ68578.1 uncharacterized protein DUF4238 [Celeribacter persicus]